MNFLVTYSILSKSFILMLLRILLARPKSYAPEHCIYVVLTMGFPYSRWWDQPEAPRLVSEVQVAADPSSHPRHRTSGSSWLPKPSCFASSSKGNNSSSISNMVGTMSTNPKLPATRISWARNCRYSTRPRSPSMPMLGFVPSSPSSLYLWSRAWTPTRPASPHNSSAAQLVSGRTTTTQCCRQITWLPGTSSRLHSGAPYPERTHGGEAERVPGAYPGDSHRLPVRPGFQQPVSVRWVSCGHGCQEALKHPHRSRD